MKTFKVAFTVNGKINKHGLTIAAFSIDDAIRSAFKTLHNVFDGLSIKYEVISVSLDK